MPQRFWRIVSPLPVPLSRIPIRGLIVSFVTIHFLIAAPSVSADGEPAEAFVKQLRNAGYFDTAILYLERAANLPGVDPSFVAAVPLEKAQTYIELALATRDADNRDAAFGDAEQSLQQFLADAGDHPRASEARLQLGKLQMIRAAQLLAGEPTEEDRKAARQSYEKASETFDGIVADLKEKLETLKGQKIDAEADPEAAARRDQYRFEFLQSQLNAADAIKLAAKTFDQPAKDKEAKGRLQDAAGRFEDLNKKYAAYIPGAIALWHLGDVYETLGESAKSLDYYLQMLEQPEVDPLREAKFGSVAGLVRIKLDAEPPEYKNAIDRADPWARQIRPNEEKLPVVQQFRMALAKAYLAKAADDSLKKGEIGRAKSDARELLSAASKVAGDHVEQAKELLAGLGIEAKPELLPTAEPPESFSDALEKANQILTVTAELDETLKLLEEKENTPELQQQRSEIGQQLRESYANGIDILRNGLVMIRADSDPESINQARQILAYFLYQTERYRETVVVGTFLARQAPGSEVGLKGGLMALTSMQLLLADVPDEDNAGLLGQLESLGKYLAKTWPSDPNAAAAQGLQIRLLLKKNDFDAAQVLIDEMDAGPERAAFKRLLGQLLWNESIAARVEEDDSAKSDMLVRMAKENLTTGLEEITGNLVEPEGMQAALVLAKIHLLEDDSAAALAVLDHPKYGPIGLSKKLEAPSEKFAGDLLSAELKALVGQMLASSSPDQYLDRMTATMEQLREVYTGPEAESKLTQTYMRLAGDLKQQLDGASPARRSKLIAAFQVMLNRISDATDDEATLRWVGQTLTSMGESLMQPGQNQADGQSADLIGQAIETFQSLGEKDDVTTAYLLGRSQRLVGDFKSAIDTFERLLKDKPMMLEAQMEAAQAYESWAATLRPEIAYKAYRAALEGSRPSPKGQNTIWGWADISSKTSKQINRSENFKEKFFDSRYHVALCLYLMGKASDRDADIRKAIKVIREAATLFPELGGPEMRTKYDTLMKESQRAVGDPATGIPTP